MGAKSRPLGFHNVKACFKPCKNRDLKCDICVSIQGKMTEFIQENTNDFIRI